MVAGLPLQLNLDARTPWNLHVVTVENLEAAIKRLES